MSTIDERRQNLGPHARRRLFYLRENWYRDVWLFVISVFVAVTLVLGVQQNGDRIVDIQKSRLENVERTCTEGNQKNMGAKARVDRLRKLGQISSEGATVTKTLIDALAPFHPDCKAYARSAVTPPDVLPEP